MALTQTAFAARTDDGELNVWSSPYAPNSDWVQEPGRPFRVRFGISGTGTVGGTLEFSTNGGTTYASVTDTSGTVQAARSSYFEDGAATSALLSSASDFISGSADEDDGVVTEVTLAGQHTEVEYCICLIPDEVTASLSILLRVAGLDSYTRIPTPVTRTSTLDQIRLRIGDTDDADPLLSDAEIETYIAAWPENSALAAATAAEAIAAKFARDFTFSTDGQSFNRRERVLHYMELAKRLRRGAFLVWPDS